VDAVLDVLAAVLLLSGAFLALTAAVGLLRFVDVLARMHGATKPQVVGILLCLAGAAVRLRDSVDVWMLLLCGAFQMLTAPVSAHLIGRLAYRTRHVRHDRLFVDDLAASDREA
jgi:multicomponent Na+:H+ antiporter subunit G